MVRDETITLCKYTTQLYTSNKTFSYCSMNGYWWKIYTLRVYYSAFFILHIHHVYVSNQIFPYCSMKINKVLNNKGESYATVVRFLTIWTAQSVELNTNDNAWKNYTLGIYYSEFHLPHISQVYISIRTCPYCSIKITKVLNNNGAPYPIVARFPSIQSAQFVEFT